MMAKLLKIVAVASAAVVAGGVAFANEDASPNAAQEQATQKWVHQAKAEIDGAPKPVTAIPEKRYEPTGDDRDADRAAVL